MPGDLADSWMDVQWQTANKKIASSDKRKKLLNTCTKSSFETANFPSVHGIRSYRKRLLDEFRVVAKSQPECRNVNS